MADLTGTNGNDSFSFQGETMDLTLTLVDPYTGETFLIDDTYNLNSSSYEGLSGIDTLFMTNSGDAIFIRDPDSGIQMVSSVEVFFAGDGGDVIHLADSDYDLQSITVLGGASDDLILANIGDDTLIGAAGNDILYGGPGDDLLFGGNDDDLLNGGSGADYLVAGGGDDILVFSIDGTYESGWYAWNIGSQGVAGTSTLVSIADTNMSLDVYNGGDGYDVLVMSDGDDTLFLENPYHDYHSSASSLRLIDVEQIDAGAGDDVIDLTHDLYEYGDITINGGDGNDFLWSSVGDDLLNGGNGNDHLYGGFGDDVLNGDDGDDELYGSLGNDILNGGDGNDVLYGGASSDSAYVETITRDHNFSGDDGFGVEDGNFSVAFDTTAEITVVGADTNLKNTLGVYNIAADGTIESVSFIFTNASDAADTAGFDVSADTDFGFFLIANGAEKNDNYSDFDLENGTLKFVYHQGASDERLATINDSEDDVTLVFEDAAGSRTVVGSNNHIYHTTTRGGSSDLNADGQPHMTSSVIDDGGTLRIAFEDQPNAGKGAKSDYDDLVFDVKIKSQTETVVTENDNDVLIGGNGDDFMDGGIGNDLLVGGHGADTLYGDQGEDIFLYQSMDDAGDTIMDFETGTNGDIINITDVLEGFDASLSDVNDFMQLVNNGNDVELHVNTDGQGNDFTALLTIAGGVGGAGLSDLLADGNLLVDQAMPV